VTLADLSAAALLTAAAIAPGSDSAITARLLYHANWLPLTPAWLVRFPDDDAVGCAVGADGRSAGPWRQTADHSWIHWTLPGGTRLSSPYKVYVSVVPDDLPLAFERCRAVFERHRTRTFKLARQPRAILRPDRLVAYAATRAETDALLADLTPALADCRGQGVPFTAGDSLALSWARDPPAGVAAFGASWRAWVTRKLAAYLHASDAPEASGRVAFACARLGDDGVDTATWAPSAGLWATT
jgi:hypothetical protein